jgi:hypothetical protein
MRKMDRIRSLRDRAEEKSVANRVIGSAFIADSSESLFRTR